MPRLFLLCSNGISGRHMPIGYPKTANRLRQEKNYENLGEYVSPELCTTLPEAHIDSPWICCCILQQRHPIPPILAWRRLPSLDCSLDKRNSWTASIPIHRRRAE